MNSFVRLTGRLSRGQPDPHQSKSLCFMCLFLFFLLVRHSRNCHGTQRAPGLKKIQSRQAILKKSSFQYGMKFSIENGFFIQGPSLAAEKQGLGLKFSIENENFKPRMKISSENEDFVRGGMIFSCVQARMIFFDPRALWGHLSISNLCCKGAPVLVRCTFVPDKP